MVRVTVKVIVSPTFGVVLDTAFAIARSAVCACAACELKVARKMPSSNAKTPARPRPANIARTSKRRAVFG